MGMDYKYAGSASYPRFDEEVKKVVEILGGKETAELKARKENEGQTFMGHWFGYASAADGKMEKYIFPRETNPLLVRWFNNIYAEYTAEETKKIFELLSPHKDAIMEVCSQMYCELEDLVEYEEGWELS